MNKILILLTLLTCNISANVKILVLIIDSDDVSCYSGLRNVWRSYMHSNPENITAYFIRGNPDQKEEYIIKDDTIWSKTEESLVPGILNKTILSLCAFENKLHEFDYVLRTNLSSFYVFDRLLKFLEDKPREKFVTSSFFYYYQYILPSGSGYIISKDVANLLITHKSDLLNTNGNPDDIVTGWFFLTNQISFSVHLRCDLWDLGRWNFVKDKIPADIFQFRVKHYYKHLRDTEEVFIAQQLLNMFYPK